MQIRAIVSGLALALLVGSSAGAATLSGAPGAGPTAAPATAVDMNMLNSFMNGRSYVVAQASCQKATEPCDDQHPCCGNLSCKATLFDKTKVCDFRG